MDNDQKDGHGLVLPPRDCSYILKELDLSTPGTFLDEAPALLAELATGYLQVGTKGLVVSLGKIAQASFTGHTLEQLRIEFRALRDAGKMSGNFEKRKYARKTWVDFLRIIDEETPDPDRLEALKSIFYAMNRMDISDKDEILAYELWSITKRLDSGDILLLKTLQEQPHRLSGMQYSQWLEQLGSLSGLGIIEAVQLHLAQLLELKLTYENRGEAVRKTVDITSLGRRLVTNIQTFRVDLEGARAKK